ncbi:MAG: SPASM domain-containing protein [Candidatus Margulisbacteria bacterium]|jgi:radical SAM protein with 4Fe4S-binding SPASM domain|nr:SPASM domain-containing protein [Candidatus Margulisiibacteriota bacterium]
MLNSLNALTVLPTDPPLLYSPQTGAYLAAAQSEAKDFLTYQKQEAPDWLDYYKKLKGKRKELQRFILNCFTPPAAKPQYQPFQTSISFLGEFKCNLACVYCFNKDAQKTLNKTKHFSEKLFTVALQKFYKQKSGWPAVDFGYSGEPLLFFDWFQKLWAINQKLAAQYRKPPAALGIMTNGLLLDDKIIAWLEQHGCWIGLSLDGGAEATNSGRGAKVFERALKNYKRIFSRNSWIKYQRGVSATISSLNPDVSRVFRDLWGEGFRQIYMKPNRAAADNPYGLNKKLWPKLKKGYQKLFALFTADLRAGRLDRLLAIASRFDYAGRFLCRILIHTPVTRRCGAAYGSVSLRNNGDVYPCDTYAAMLKHQLGNIYTGFKWERDFIPAVDDLEHCRACAYRYICGGACRVWQEYNDGDASVECALNKFLIELCFQLAAELEKYPEQKQLLSACIKHNIVPPTRPGSRKEKK